MEKVYTSDGRSYEGMSPETVQSLLVDMGLSSTITDKATYDAFVESNKPPARITPDLTQEKSVLKDPKSTTDDKLAAVIKILGL